MPFSYRDFTWVKYTSFRNRNDKFQGKKKKKKDTKGRKKMFLVPTFGHIGTYQKSLSLTYSRNVMEI